MMSMGVDQIKELLGVFDRIADVSIGMRRTAAVNRDGMHCGIKVFGVCFRIVRLYFFKKGDVASVEFLRISYR